jgi:NADP-dependent 3-hydroxy acid dehydrogenase YdfG
MKEAVLITGSSTGIGQATAYAFAKAGYNIVVTHYNQEKEGKSTIAQCLKLGAESALLVSLDITNDKSISAALSAVKIVAVNPGSTATPMSGFQGIHPSKVADLIVGTVKGTHKVKSGGDVDVWKIYHQKLS